MAEMVVRIKGEDQGGVKTLEDVTKAMREQSAEFAKAQKASAAENKGLREQLAALTQQTNARKEFAKTLQMAESIIAVAESNRQKRIQNIFRENEALIEQVKTERALAEARRASAKEIYDYQQADKADRGGGGGMLAAGGMAGLASTISSEIVSGVKEAFDTLMEHVAKQSEGMVNFAKKAENYALMNAQWRALQAPGKEGLDLMQQVYKVGMGAGLLPDQTGAMAMTIQSTFDANADKKLTGDELKKFKTGMSVAADLVNIGVAAEDAQKIVVSGNARGEDTLSFANKYKIASDQSASMGPADMAKITPSIARYTTSEAGFALAAGLSNTYTNPEMLPEKMRALRRAVGPGTESTKLSQMMGLAGLNEVDAIDRVAQYLSEHGDQSLPEDKRIEKAGYELSDTKKYGLEIQESEALQVALKHRAQTRTALIAMQTQDPTQNLVHESLVASLEDPNFAAGIQGKQVKAALAYEQMYGKRAPARRAELAQKRAEGMALTEAGYEGYVDPDTGETTMPYTQRVLGRTYATVAKASGAPGPVGAAMAGAVAEGGAASVLPLAGSVFGPVGTGIGFIGQAGAAIHGAYTGYMGGAGGSAVAEGVDNPFTAQNEGKSILPNPNYSPPETAMATPGQGGPAASSEAEGESAFDVESANYGNVAGMTDEQRKYYGFEKNADGSYVQPDDQMTDEQRKYYGFQKNEDGSYKDSATADESSVADTKAYSKDVAATMAAASEPAPSGDDMASSMRELNTTIKTLTETLQQNNQATQENTQVASAGGSGGGGGEKWGWDDPAMTVVNRNGNS